MGGYHDINLNKGNGAARSFLVRGLITVVGLAVSLLAKLAIILQSVERLETGIFSRSSGYKPPLYHCQALFLPHESGVSLVLKDASNHRY
jgi:hypothetical protein